jgi:hypothetical protein
MSFIKNINLSVPGNESLRNKSDAKEFKVIVDTAEWKRVTEDFRRFRISEMRILLGLVFSQSLCLECTSLAENAKVAKMSHVHCAMNASYYRKPLESGLLLLLKLIRKKLSGYKQQDICKSRYSPERFITHAEVLSLLVRSQLKCYFCKKATKLFHEETYDSMQFSLDRIDNNDGHNSGNMLLACLKCNLRRRRQMAEKYRFTKQLKIRKLDHLGEPINFSKS